MWLRNLVQWFWGFVGRLTGSRKPPRPDAIKHVVEPESWGAKGTYATTLPGCIVVRQTAEIQAKVFAFLTATGALTNGQRPSPMLNMQGGGMNGGGFGGGGFGSGAGPATAPGGKPGAGGAANGK